ncbi:molybdopterin-guanine dinucleotide biosynthesis protein A [Oceanicola sp. 22II-s10i]|uniref:molybdenum cofactor guanylyltransferase MobA n=1 Tax=Oceanicola sp. 22II-s10i TaxID=1317116 RepID=UPI000B524537|nr:molybdenum cofactor guanylyltransferase MobA [Oceanicola sp. 22II-s10i]OWU85427.1 molybdopterin-guanine dinucleotide biosynthesis protein A [Oceanicola sp. 22II-s10i]
MKAPAGVILAGGQGRRMGGADKAALRLGGRALIDHVADRFLPQVDPAAISANGDPGRFARFGLPVLADGPDEGLGPLAGVLAGLDWAAGAGADTVVTVSVDTPFLPQDLVPRLLMVTEGMTAPLAVAAGPDGIHPTCALWPVAIREDLRAALRQGVRRIGAWAEEMGARRAFFPDGETAFLNLNRPDDIARAEALLAGGA